MRPHLKMGGASFRIDESYVRVCKVWKYLYRAVDGEGATIEFVRSAKRDISAAKGFFKKMMRADRRRGAGVAPQGSPGRTVASRPRLNSS
jgi:transposase-like protein